MVFIPTPSGPLWMRGFIRGTEDENRTSQKGACIRYRIIPLHSQRFISRINDSPFGSLEGCQIPLIPWTLSTGYFMFDPQIVDLRSYFQMVEVAVDSC